MKTAYCNRTEIDKIIFDTLENFILVDGADNEFIRKIKELYPEKKLTGILIKLEG